MGRLFTLLLQLCYDTRNLFLQFGLIGVPLADLLVLLAQLLVLGLVGVLHVGDPICQGFVLFFQGEEARFQVVFLLDVGLDYLFKLIYFKSH